MEKSVLARSTSIFLGMPDLAFLPQVLLTQQNKFPSLHGRQAAPSCLGLFPWQQRDWRITTQRRGRDSQCGVFAETCGDSKDTDPRVLEKQEQQQPTYLALSYINRFMTDAARREQETMKKKATPKLSLSITGAVSRNSTATPPRHTSGNLTPPVTPPITPSSSFRSSTPTGSEYDEEEVDYEESDSDESWTTESAISSESILSSMCMNGGEDKPFACPVPGCKKRYKNVNGIKYHAKNGHRTQIRVRKPFKCRCGKSYKTSQGLRHHTINFHPPVSADILRKIQG
ncbi:juxtaposed with another zinc finger protein 1 isoform X2 [Entelurus aequoreus]|uniref:juxtaposed with another zinc finger protein 1 isoform X2 n=1 Tax=Entelurus aequoreus TaxID=161455 RepID=UPI002B1DEDFA|nr:juxtaposed with another zinc finger protein 1 isoform X2 [Entelurus aequoreus]